MIKGKHIQQAFGGFVYAFGVGGVGVRVGMPSFRMKHLLKILVISTFIVSSCNGGSDKKIITKTNDSEVRERKDSLLVSRENTSKNDRPNLDFLKQYKFTTLPIILKGCFGKSYSLSLIKQEDLKCDKEDGTLSYCTFKTNGDYFAVVRIGLADCALPYLITYDKNGNKIDEKFLGIGMCGFGPGYTCEEFTIIKSDFTIYSSDTISEVEIDNLGREIKATEVNYVIYKTGKLLSSGKIELTDTIRKRI